MNTTPQPAPPALRADESSPPACRPARALIDPRPTTHAYPALSCPTCHARDVLASPTLPDYPRRPLPSLARPTTQPSPRRPSIRPARPTCSPHCWPHRPDDPNSTSTNRPVPRRQTEAEPRRSTPVRSRRRPEPSPHRCHPTQRDSATRRQADPGRLPCRNPSRADSAVPTYAPRADAPARATATPTRPDEASPHTPALALTTGQRHTIPIRALPTTHAAIRPSRPPSPPSSPPATRPTPPRI